MRFVAVTHARYVCALLALLTVWWIALAIDPLDRQDWLLENAQGFCAYQRGRRSRGL
jgi:hypothetical protein